MQAPIGAHLLHELLLLFVLPQKSSVFSFSFSFSFAIHQWSFRQEIHQFPSGTHTQPLSEIYLEIKIACALGSETVIFLQKNDYFASSNPLKSRCFYGKSGTYEFLRLCLQPFCLLSDLSLQLMSSLWAVYEQFMSNLWAVYEQFMSSLWAVYEQFMSNWWAVDEQFMSSLWAVYEQMMSSLWAIYEQFTVALSSSWMWSQAIYR